MTQCTLLKMKVLHDATEKFFFAGWFHKEPLTSKEPFCFKKGSYQEELEAFKHLYFQGWYISELD